MGYSIELDQRRVFGVHADDEVLDDVDSTSRESMSTIVRSQCRVKPPPGGEGRDHLDRRGGFNRHEAGLRKGARNAV